MLVRVEELACNLHMMADLHPSDPTPMAADEACMNPHPSNLTPDAAQAILISANPIHSYPIPTLEQEIPTDPIPMVAEEACINTHSSNLTLDAAQAILISADPIHSDPIPTPKEAITTDPIPTDPHTSNLTPDTEQAIPIEYLLRQAWDRVKSDHPNVSWKIHRFPASLRAFCEERHYIAPKMVAIGPYYHHLPELQDMEVVKKVATHHFFVGASLQVGYEKVVAVAGTARSCYDTRSLEGFNDAEFALMMFHDVCFLLVTILAITWPKECPLSLVCRTGANTLVVVTRHVSAGEPDPLGGGRCTHEIQRC